MCSTAYDMLASNAQPLRQLTILAPLTLPPVTLFHRTSRRIFISHFHRTFSLQFPVLDPLISFMWRLLRKRRGAPSTIYKGPVVCHTKHTASYLLCIPDVNYP